MRRLTPKAGSQPIDLETFLARTEEAFSEVVMDLREGEIQKAIHLSALEKLAAPVELIDRRRALNAAIITVVDDEVGEEGCVSFLYFPGEEIIIGFSGPCHEEQGGIVAARLAEELGYDLSTG